MYASAFDLFKIGFGPSSSYTIGPMLAANRFARELAAAGKLEQTAQVIVDLYGSLALVGRSHGVNQAVILGLSGYTPDTIEPETIPSTLARIREQRIVALDGRHSIVFSEPEHLRYRVDKTLAFHGNAIRIAAFDRNAEALARNVYFSIGGGCVVDEMEAQSLSNAPALLRVPYPFATTTQLLTQGAAARKRIPEMMRINELALRSPDQVKNGLLGLWKAMNASIDRGMDGEGVLPGGLQVVRRAKRLRAALQSGREQDPTRAPDRLESVAVYAVAVAEENAAGGRIVTAPTNGAAGIVPAVIRHYRESEIESNEDGIVSFLLTATAIGGVCRRNAAKSGAAVGCQGEVGVASAMAAAGLVAALGGSNTQIEHAAETALEQHLGMTCDPAGGLVQLPCIDRNATGAAKAVDAAMLALKSDGQHRGALDAVIKSMYESGRNMMSKYKTDSLGDIAVNIIEC